MSGLFLLLAAAVQAEPVPVGALYRAALDHAPALGAAAAGTERAGYEKGGVAAGFWPRIDAVGSVQGWRQDSRPSATTRVRPDRQEALELRVEQAVFQGGETFNRYRAAASRERAASRRHQAEREALLREVGLLSLSWHESSEASAQAQAELERRLGHLEAAKKRQAAGVLPEAEVIRAGAEVQQAVSERLEAERALLEARSRLETLTGLDLSAGIAAPAAMPTPSAGREELAREASARNPAVLAGEESRRAAELGAAARLGRFFPQVAVGGGYRTTRESPRTLLFLARETYGFAQARWALFAGGERLAAARAAEAEAREASEELRRTRDARSLGVRLAFDAAHAAEGAVLAESRREESARTAYDRTLKRYEAGLDSTLNLLDAATALKAAESGLVRARYARERALVDLYWALGRLEETVSKL